MKTNSEEQTFLENLIEDAVQQGNPKFELTQWNRLLDELEKGDYFNQTVSGYSRVRRKFFGMPSVFQMDFEKAKMLAPRLIDYKGVSLEFTEEILNRHHYFFNFSFSNVRRISFVNKECLQGIYFVERGQDWRKNWRDEKEIIIVPDSYEIE